MRIKNRHHRKRHRRVGKLDHHGPKRDRFYQFCVCSRKINAVPMLFSSSSIRRVNRLAERSEHLLNIDCDPQRLATKTRWAQPREDHVYQSSWAVPVYTAAVWTAECVHQQQNGNGPCLVSCQLVVGSRLPIRYFQFFQNRRATFSHLRRVLTELQSVGVAFNLKSVHYSLEPLAILVISFTQANVR